MLDDYNPENVQFPQRVHLEDLTQHAPEVNPQTFREMFLQHMRKSHEELCSVGATIKPAKLL